ncbi:hypothetical protein F5884DRAFT_234110 [Xylogone sp. PMI_703]|nr:hypothetical protein F5884DRAFT_234110 [Xylogone sp. PMI_703]
MSRRAGTRVSDFEERDYYSDRGPSGVRIRERDVEEVDTYRRERLPHFMQSDFRREEQGPLVLRSRPHERSPSEVRISERFVERERSPSPERERVRARVVERREREPSQVRRVIETRERIRERERSPSPPVVVRERLVERLKSPSPPPVERIRTRIIEREKKEPSPSPSPSPPPPAPIIAPPIHQEIITHHRHIDHGFERPKAPSPPPPPRRSERTKETDIDIYTSRNQTEVDIRKTIRSRTPEPPRPRRTFVDDNYIYEQEHDKLKVRDERLELTRRRSVSSRPRERSRSRVRIDIDDEAEYYNKKAEKRAFIGEAYNGATKDWTIVDVPPGTERVRMDGVGGGSQEITWQRYNGVRRSKFIPERDRENREKERERFVERVEIDEPRRSSTGFEIEISTKRKEGPTYERDYERIEETIDRRGPRGPKGRVGDLWTEITKDLVTKEAIEELGYDYEETEFFFYVLEYLRYEDVLELVELSEDIRSHRRERVREITFERDRMREEDRWARRRDHDDRYDEERVVEREIIYDGAPRRRRGDW